MSERIVGITGATVQLGPEVARRFADDGARLALIVRSEDEIRTIQQALPGGADAHRAIAADLGSERGARAAAATLREQLEPPVCLLHLIGGYAGRTTLEDAEEHVWRGLFERNFWTAFHVIRAVLPDIRSATHGRIVTASTPLAATPVAGIGPYAASKAAVETLTRIAAGSSPAPRRRRTSSWSGRSATGNPRHPTGGDCQRDGMARIG